METNWQTQDQWDVAEVTKSSTVNLYDFGFGKQGKKDSWNVLELQQVVTPRIIRLGICPSALVYDENLGNEEKSHCLFV